MAKILNSQTNAAYEESALVYRGRKQFSDAVEALVTEHGMNEGSAKDFLNNFKQLMNGEAYNRTLNGYATKYFLEKISHDFGRDALLKALQSVDGHIKYYENLNHGKLRNIRKIYDEFVTQTQTDSEFSGSSSDFEQQVAKSLSDSDEARKKRIESTPKLPGTKTISVVAYIRNPDVVAEVILRAAGICENCNRPAPFKRSKDGSPFLEVHHRLQLALGGEDTVENAMAVCPNCHRELHFG